METVHVHSVLVLLLLLPLLYDRYAGRLLRLHKRDKLARKNRRAPSAFIGGRMPTNRPIHIVECTQILIEHSRLPLCARVEFINSSAQNQKKKTLLDTPKERNNKLLLRLNVTGVLVRMNNNVAST